MAKNANVSLGRNVKRQSKVSALPLIAMFLFGGLVSACSENEPKSYLENTALGNTANKSCAVTDGGSHVTLLGTAGGPIHRKFRSQPASLLTVDGIHYLIDAGDGVARQLVKAGVDIPDVKQVFLTHLHADHTIGLAPLLMFDWALVSTSPISVYGPPGTKLFLKRALDYISIPVEVHRSQYPPVLSPSELFFAIEPDVEKNDEPSMIYADDKVKVTAIENSHFVTMKSVSREYGYDRAYSYRFETDSLSVVFSGDTGPSRSLQKLAQNADMLVIEVIDLDKQIQIMRNMTNIPESGLKVVIDHMSQEHITPEEIGRLANAASVGRVVLTHLVPGHDAETSSRPYVEGIKKYYKGPVQLGVDLDCF